MAYPGQLQQSEQYVGNSVAADTGERRAAGMMSTVADREVQGVGGVAAPSWPLRDHGGKPAAASDRCRSWYWAGRRAGMTYRRGRRAYVVKIVQGKIYNFLERPTGWKCFIYHFTVYVYIQL